MGVTGQSLPPKNDFEHARGLRNSAYAVNLTYDRHTYRHIYISREISIEHPSVGLASLAQLEQWFPLQGELAQSFKKFYVHTLVKNKIERRKRRRQKKNRPINLPQGNNIVHILRVHYLTLNFIIHNNYQLCIYIHTYIHT